MKIQKRVKVTLNTESEMKKFKKAQVIAKNHPYGSYAAGCGTNDTQTCDMHCMEKH